MFERDRSFFRSLGGSIVAGGVLLTCLVAPALAAGGEPAAAKQSAISGAKSAQVDPIEARIHELHDKLQISEAQAGQWEGVARVMRGNAKSIEAMVREKRKNEKDMTAIEDLRAYQEISLAHAKAAAKLADAFEILYQTMSDDQKKLTDAVFRQHKQDVTAVRK
jgi:hypothetical protein